MILPSIKTSVKNTLYKRPAIVRSLVKFFIRTHNYSYKKITEYSSILNEGFNPKHAITRYHEYYVKNISANDTILDIGCGVGYLAYDMAAKAQKVIGIDISEKNIGFAKKLYSRPNLEFIVGDATTYPFSGKFDAVALSNVLEHISDRVGLLRKIGALSDKLILRVPMVTRDWMTVYKRDNGYPYKLDDTHETEYSLEDVQAEAAASGWEIESHQVNWGEFWGVLKRKK